MKILAIVSTLVLALAFAQADDDISIEEFEKEFHQLTNDKSIEEQEAEALAENEKVIDEINEEYKEGKETFFDKVNPMSDVADEILDDPEAFKGLNMPTNMSRGLGLVMPTEIPVDEESENFFRRFRLSRGAAPSSFDAVGRGLVTPVKNQGQCGSCASFASVATVETCFKGLTGKASDLSEQQLMDCGFNGEAMNGCNGAAPHAYNDWLSSHQDGQLAHENTVPYKMAQQSCSSAPIFNTGAKVYKSYYSYSMDETTLMGLVATYGAVLTGIYASDRAFTNYGGGIYDKCAAGVQPNHAVVVVGYGEENGVKYWKVKNSWGSNWGESGFFRMKRGVGMCGIGSTASLPMCQAASGATSAPITTTPPPPSATCDISDLYGPGITYDRITLQTGINGVTYTATVKCVNSVCSLVDGGSSNACMSICGMTKCSFGRSDVSSRKLIK